MKYPIILNQEEQEFIKEWQKALLSGQYKQGQESLYSEEENTYCCLGVACAIEDVDREKLVFQSYIDGDVINYKEHPILTSIFIEKNENINFQIDLANFNDGIPDINLKKEFKLDLNDYTFEHIANKIIPKMFKLD